MKKLVLLTTLLLLPAAVLAELVLDGPLRGKINVGEEVFLTGYLKEPIDAVFTLRFILKCGQEQQLLVRSVAVSRNVRKDFSESIIMPATAEGLCTIQSEALSGAIREQATSRQFTVTKELDGTFEIDKGSIKLGELLKIKGNIIKLDGSPVSGTAVIRLVQEDNVYFSAAVPVTNGGLDYTFNSRENPAGQYSVEVEVLEAMGNHEVFNAGSFEITSNITLVAETDKVHALPNDKIKLFGEASIEGATVDSGKARIDSFGMKKEVDLSGGTFTTTLTVPSDTKAGQYEIAVFVADEHGNTGFFAPRVVIDQYPKRLEVRANKKDFQPGEIVVVTPVLMDQTDDVILGDVSLKIVTPIKKEVLTELVKSNLEYEFSLLNTALPGVWRIEASTPDLKESIAFTVGELKSLFYEMRDQKLHVTNDGNVRFEGLLEIVIENAEMMSTIVKEISADVNETAVINLRGRVASGTYTVKVADKEFEDVYIDGKRELNSSWLAYVAAFIAVSFVVGLFVFLKRWSFRRRLKRTMRKERARSKHGDGYVNVSNIAVNEKNKPMRFKLKGRGGHQLMFEFPKKRTVHYRESTRYNERDKGDGGGLFNMFG